jgi:hypothetical protein
MGDLPPKRNFMYQAQNSPWGCKHRDDDESFITEWVAISRSKIQQIIN